ncbi:MAG: hypothetical protein ABFS41_03325 [Myxococcota bacterium]
MTFAILTACGGFLIAVLWMDLMFDVQTLRQREDVLPEAVLDSIAGYYRRVTTEAAPMSRLVALVMAVAVATTLTQLVVEEVRWASAISLLLAGVPIALAQTRIFPAAARLGGQQDTPETQSRLARQICRDHLVCLAAMVAFTALQLLSIA